MWCVFSGCIFTCDNVRSSNEPHFIAGVDSDDHQDVDDGDSSDGAGGQCGTTEG